MLDLAPHGYLAAVRLVEPMLPKRVYTTPDWLSEVVLGATKKYFQAPLIDFSGYARRDDPSHIDHPIASLVGWHDVLDGWVIRDRMTALNEAQMNSASLQWWVDHTNLADANGQWPASHLVRNRLSRSSPSPKTPYHLASSATGQRTRTYSRHGNDLANKGRRTPVVVRDGWDDFDLAAVKQAANFVRDPRTFEPLHPAVLMALADTEGYRLFTIDNRVPSSWAEHWNSMQHKNAAFTRRGSRLQQSFMNIISRWTWTGWPFGLDVLTKKRAEKIFPKMANLGIVQAISDQFQWVVGELRSGADPDQWLLDPAFVPTGNIEKFVVDRLETRWSDDGKPQHRRLTRRLEVVGLTLQAAIFQWSTSRSF